MEKIEQRKIVSMVSAADPQGLDFNEDDEQMDFNDVLRVSE